MQCMKDYIGIKGCGLPVPDSGYYINSLPGIEIAMLDQIATADQQNFQGLWADVQEAAIIRFRDDVLGHYTGFDKRYRLKQITQTVDLGNIVDTTLITPPSPKRRGHTIELNGKGDQCVCSNLQAIYVQSSSFYAIAPGPVTLSYYDIDQQILLASFSITATAGWNLFKTDQVFSAARIAVVVDVTSISTYKIDLGAYGLGLYQSASDTCSNCNWGTNNAYLWFDIGCTGTALVQGYEYDPVTLKEVYASNTFGVSSVFSVTCTYNNIVCNNKKSFAPAFRWLLGAEILTYRTYTSRINRWSTIDLKRATELRSEYEIEYRGGQKKGGSLIEGALMQAIAGIDFNPSDACIQSDAPIRYAESLP
jgi:hypothetical protein